MSWTRKEKELSPQEAIALAREELSPYWMGSDPLLIGLEQAEGYQAFPLNREFIKQLWLVIIVDPTTFCGVSALDLVREMESRYRVLSLNILVVYSVRYHFQKNPTAAQKWFEEATTTCVRCFDVNSRLVSAFRGVEMPKVLLFKEGKKLFEFSGQGWISEMDSNVQKALRLSDPGLPLLPVLKSVKGLSFDLQSVNLNANSMSFPGLILSGHWDADEEKIWTKDVDAQLSFRSAGSEVSILARTKDNTDIVPSLVVELCGLPPYDAVRGKHLRMSDNSELIVTLSESKLFSILTQLPSDERQVTVRFRNVNNSPVEIYGLRFGDRMRAVD